MYDLGSFAYRLKTAPTPIIPRALTIQWNDKDIDMKQLLKQLAVDETGQDLIEYALIAAMVGLGTQAVIKGTDTDILRVFNNIGNQLTNSVA